MSGLPLIVLRPEPGASVSIGRATAAGIDAVALPLFALEPLAWQPPSLKGHQALLLTSANAVTLAGPQLAALAGLPAWCVGAATAATARAAGLTVDHVGTAGVQALVDTGGPMGLLWLAGEDRTVVQAPEGGRIEAIQVYRAVPLPVDPAALQGPAVVLVHSTRAAQRLVEIAPQRSVLQLVAISSAVAAACGDDWQSVAVAPHPDDAEMVAIAAKLCQDDGRGSRQ